MKEPTLMQRAEASRRITNDCFRGKSQKAAELMAFMEIFHGRKLTRREAERMLEDE